MKIFFNSKNQFLVAIGVFVSRLSFLPANFSPLGSFGFFGGNIILFTISIIAFDFFFSGAYKGMIFTYFGFFSYFLLGRIAKDNVKLQITLLPLASILFFLFSNFGSWLYWYPQTLSGLVQCYTLAIPFLVNTLLGDMFFGYSYLILKNLILNKKLRLGTKYLPFSKS